MAERTGYIARVRKLARLAAQAYVRQRERLGFPMIADPAELRLGQLRVGLLVVQDHQHEFHDSFSVSVGERGSIDPVHRHDERGTAKSTTGVAFFVDDEIQVQSAG